MKPGKLLVYFSVLLLLVPVPTAGANRKRKPHSAARVQAARPSNAEVQELLRRAGQAAEEARAEARRAREQSEELQRRLDENTRELDRLRRTIAEFGSYLAELKSASPETKPAETAQTLPQVAPAENPVVAERLDRLQEQIEVHTAQLKEHAQTKVESDGKHRVRLFGLILANTYYNSDDSTLSDVPLVALPQAAVRHRNNFGATLRQTRIGLAFDGPRLGKRLGEARVSAEAEFDFWGGQVEDSERLVLGSLRIITASARLDWERASLIVGQRPPLVSPLNPTSLAAVWFAPMTAAGNLWQWRPQIIVEHRTPLQNASELIVQGGVMTPFGETVQGSRIEGGLGYETRVAFRRTLQNDQNLEIGIGGYAHRRPFPLGRRVTSYALTSDWQLPIGERLALSGEAYFGRAVSLGEQSGGPNDRYYAITGRLENPATQARGNFTVGGWAQLSLRARSDLDFNFAWGQNDPRNRDLRQDANGATLLQKNQVASANFIWQLRHNFLVSLEYRRLWTNYPTQRRTNNHVNLAFGYVF
jgi:hypothetical protein